jgi:hypothetical protein
VRHAEDKALLHWIVATGKRCGKHRKTLGGNDKGDPNIAKDPWARSKPSMAIDLKQDGKFLHGNPARSSRKYKKVGAGIDAAPI